jgi:hypothetical protein
MSLESDNVFDDFLVRFVRTIKTVLIGSPENSVYGHQRIMAEFAALDSNTKARGRIQHGWVPQNILRHSYTNCYVTSFVWSKYSEIESQKLGWSNIYAIGAPWLYFLKNIEQLQTLSINQDSSYKYDELWVYGNHSVDIHSQSEALCQYLKFVSLSSNKRKAVLLYYTDYQSLKLNKNMVFEGLDLHTLTTSRNKSISADSLYYSLYHLLSQSKKVIVDHPTSLLLYALSLNKAVDIVYKSHGSKFLQKRLTKTSDLMLIGLGHLTNEQNIREFALRELGQDCMRSQQDISRLLFCQGRKFSISILTFRILDFIKIPINIFRTIKGKRHL